MLRRSIMVLPYSKVMDITSLVSIIVLALVSSVHGTYSTNGSTTLIVAGPEKPQLGSAVLGVALELSDEWTFEFRVKPVSGNQDSTRMRGIFHSIVTVLLREDLELWVGMYSYKDDAWHDTMFFHAGKLPLRSWTHVIISGSNTDQIISVQYNTSSVWRFYLKEPFTPWANHADEALFTRTNEDPADVFVKQLKYSTFKTDVAPGATPVPRPGDGDNDSEEESTKQPELGSEKKTPPPVEESNSESNDDGSGISVVQGVVWATLIVAVSCLLGGAVLFSIRRERKQRIKRTEAVLDNISRLQPSSPANGRVRSVVFAAEKPNSLSLP